MCAVGSGIPLHGSVRGMAGDSHPYRDRICKGALERRIQKVAGQKPVPLIGRPEVEFTTIPNPVPGQLDRSFPFMSRHRPLSHIVRRGRHTKSALHRTTYCR